jgi:hypothetical protein
VESEFPTPEMGTCKLRHKTPIGNYGYSRTARDWNTAEKPTQINDLSRNAKEENRTHIILTI